MGRLCQNNKNRRMPHTAPEGGMWQNIRRLGNRSGRSGKMWFFLGGSVYFMVLYTGDYGEPAYLPNLSAVAAMALELFVLLRFTVWEGEHWRFLYEKVKYFPISRKAYLLSQAALAGKALGLQLLVQWTVFTGRAMMGQGIGVGSMAMVTLCTVAGGIWCFLSFLGVSIVGERAWGLLPPLLLAGIGIVNLL